MSYSEEYADHVNFFFSHFVERRSRTEVALILTLKYVYF